MVLLGEVDTFDTEALALRINRNHLAFLATVLAREHFDRIALLDLHLEDLRRQRNDSHELLVSQLAPDWAEDTSASWLAVRLDENSKRFSSKRI